MRDSRELGHEGLESRQIRRDAFEDEIDFTRKHPALAHERLGPVRTLGLPVKFSDTPGKVARGAPLYGQHSREILREHGFADDEIDQLLAEGAIAEPGAEGR